MSDVLGRGLDALLSGDGSGPEAEKLQSSSVASSSVSAEASSVQVSSPLDTPRVKESVFWIETVKICPNPEQPRTVFDQEKIAELSESIRQYGILQPIVVSKVEIDIPTGTRIEYQIIAGERRYRAASMLGLTQMPAIIRKEESQRIKLELALIENLQREDLNGIEKAKAYKRLVDDFNLNPREVGLRVGKSREAVTNTMRLLALPENVQAALMQGRVSEGQVRPLISLGQNEEEQQALFNRILTHGLSSRDVERESRELMGNLGLMERPTKRNEKAQFEAATKMFEEKLAGALGTRVSVRRSQEGKGRISIEFFSDDEFKGILARIANPEENQASVPSSTPDLNSFTV